MADTTNYGWTKPTVGGSSGTWGTLLNAFIDALDADLQAVSDVADAAVPAAGGTMTGPLNLLSTSLAHSALGSVSGATPLDLETASSFSLTPSAATTLSFDNPSDVEDVVIGFLLEITDGGGSIVWPGSVEWPNGAAPTLQATGVDILVFISRDAGVTWRGALILADVS